MKVQIIGLGTVGMAQAVLLRCLGHEDIIGVDLDENKGSDSFLIKRSREYVDSDLTFVCTPESEVSDVIEKLNSGKISGLPVIKSTVKPGTTNELMTKLNMHICHNPEFFRQNSSIEDSLNPSRIMIGACCEVHAKALVDLYSPLNRPLIVTSPTMSELAKLVVNALRSTIITFWNEMNELCSALDLDVKELAKIVETDKAIGVYEGGNWGTRFFGVPFGGMCLPKDLRQLVEVFRSRQLNPLLFEVIEAYNKKLSGG